MIKKLTRHGHSMALVIERGVLDLLNIDADTPLEVSTDGQVLIVSPIRNAGRHREFTRALANVNRKCGRMLKRLAD
jgi:antitoxin component of MazEF toxin-antitoxin module